MAKSQLEILLVGAGPVGLTAAVELARRGFKPRIIDKGGGPVIESRALGVNARSLEILEPCGATKLMIERGSKIRRMNFWDLPKLIFSIPMEKLQNRYNFMLALPQDDTEQVLIEVLGELGHEVEWNTELTELKLTATGARAKIKKGSRTSSCDADIVIGADGAHSRVRHALGIGFRGSSIDHEFSLADAIVSGPTNEHEANISRVSSGIFCMIPVAEGRFRLVADQPDILNAVPSVFKIEETVWQSRFHISYRQVESYQKGNVFLAGDAAHIHSPVGGRGMNLGIEDAATLAWLIDQERTDEYTERRLPVGAHVLRQTNWQTQLMTSLNPLVTFMRRQVVPLLMKSNFVLSRQLPEMAGLAAPPPPWL
jgi:2-polyprenyl-6-methoxyphenol hydroxylase-like FAD-dependent oxidoreductase